jgi:hypothetical protein
MKVFKKYFNQFFPLFTLQTEVKRLSSSYKHRWALQYRDQRYRTELNIGTIVISIDEHSNIVISDIGQSLISEFPISD